MDYQAQLINLIKNNPEFIKILQVINRTHLPQATLCGGAVRNLVWDQKNHVPSTLVINNLDVFYNDRSESSEETLIVKARLNQAAPKYLWNLHNIALPKRFSSDIAADSIEDAIKAIPETASAVGVNLTPGGDIMVVAPYGLDDLFEQKLRPTPVFAQNDHGLVKFNRRIDRKNWLTKYAGVELADDAK